jgi:hypothetical protein
MDTVLLMQPRSTGGKVVATPEEICTNLAVEMRNDLPKLMDFTKAHETTFAETEPGVINSLGVFVKQEI